jgi:hypothetical protein
VGVAVVVTIALGATSIIWRTVPGRVSCAEGLPEPTLAEVVGEPLRV